MGEQALTWRNDGEKKKKNNKPEHLGVRPL